MNKEMEMPEQEGTQKTEGKPGTKLTPWIFGAVILVALVWIFSSIIDLPQQDAEMMVDTLQSPSLAEGDTGVGGPVAISADHVTAFAQFARRDGDAPRASNHSFAAEGILHLADAIYAIADRIEIRDIEFTRRVDILRDYGQDLQRSGDTIRSTGAIRQAFLFANDMMATLQQGRFPAAAEGITEARRAAESLRPDRPLPEQNVRVEEYFRLASAALSTMTTQ